MAKSQKRKRPVEKGRDYIPVTVPFTATPAGETPGIDRWAHRVVWTDRMLATLYFTERGFISLNAAHVRFVQSIGTY
jgi:hypothetical protein